MTLSEPCRHVWRYEKKGVRSCIYCGSTWVFSDDPEDYGWTEVWKGIE